MYRGSSCDYTIHHLSSTSEEKTIILSCSENNGQASDESLGAWAQICLCHLSLQEGITPRSVCSREHMGLHYAQSHPGLGFECRNYSNMFRTYEDLQGHRASRSCQCYLTRMCSYVDYSSCFPLIFGV
jgi:hypothetical protein